MVVRREVVGLEVVEVVTWFNDESDVRLMLANPNGHYQTLGWFESVEQANRVLNNMILSMI